MSHSPNTGNYRGILVFGIISWLIIVGSVVIYSQNQNTINEIWKDNFSPNDYTNISKIYITADVLNQLKSEWSSTVNEFRYCMYAEKYKDSYLISHLSQPNIISSNQYGVLAEDCPLDSIGSIHSHSTFEICLLSTKNNNAMNEPYADAELLSMQNYPFMGIICDPEKIVIYTKSSESSITLMLVNEDEGIQDITVTNPCQGNRYCNGKCWGPCDDVHKVWKCNADGGICEYEPGYCPSGQRYCNGKCWTDCSTGVWRCTSQGALCS